MAMGDASANRREPAWRVDFLSPRRPASLPRSTRAGTPPSPALLHRVVVARDRDRHCGDKNHCPAAVSWASGIAERASTGRSAREALPATDGFSSLEVIGGRLLLLGGVQESSVVYAYSVPLAGGRGVGTCDVAVVDPQTLAIGPVKTANCGDPTLYGQRVLALTYFSRHAAPRGEMPASRSGSRAPIPKARDGYALGPVVTTYEQCSDCQAGVDIRRRFTVDLQPDGLPVERLGRAAADLAPDRGGGRAVGDAQNPARTTGDQLQRAVAVPVLGVRRAPEASPDRGSTPYETLYRITPGNRTPQRVLTLGNKGSGARWLLASGDTASAAIDKGHGYSAVWTFTAGKRPVHGPTLTRQSD